MELDYFTILLLNLPLMLSLYLVSLILTSSLLDQKPDKKSTLIFIIPCTLLIVFPASLFYRLDLFGSLFISLIEIYLETAAWAIAAKGIFHIRWRHTFAAAGLSVFLCRTISSLNGIFLSRNFDLTVPRDLAVYLFTESCGLVLPALFIVWVIRKNKLSEEYLSVLGGEEKASCWWLLFFALPGLDMIVVELTNEKVYLNNSNPIVSALLLLLIYGILNYTFRCNIQKERIHQQMISLNQQKLYIQNLETVQKEVRHFRHDFKNMMAGASLQAKEGNLQAVREFISGVTEDFERQVGKQIFQITQTGNIQITELKGLLILKMTEAQEKKLPFRLEVPNPFCDPGMSERDLCRAVGILLDNALEAAETEDNGAVTAIFYDDGELIHIIIRNTAAETVPVSRIWEDGYSTKGSRRGNGLPSFRQIVNRYDQAASCTRQENGSFIQELIIRKTGGKRHGSNLSV